MKLTWYGHSAFRLEFGTSVVLIDPFLSGNPRWTDGWEPVAQGVTHVLLTHGHDDHVGDALAILKATGAMLVANFEVCEWLVGKGVDEGRINFANHGGTVDCGGWTTTLTQAVHSSSTTRDGVPLYLGHPAGLVVKAPGEPVVFHMGDTDIFSDMALIHELHAPEIGIVPVGDRYTMGAKAAALACRRFFRFGTAIPCHYGTFPALASTADAFMEAMGTAAAIVRVPTIGMPFTLEAKR